MSAAQARTTIHAPKVQRRMARPGWRAPLACQARLVTFIAAMVCLLFAGASAQGQATTASVNVGTLPYAAALNPVTNKIYVANSGTNNVTVIDGATNKTLTVSAGTDPIAVAVNPVTNKIYVANQGSNNVTVIDGLTNTPSTLAVGTGPSAVAVNPVTNQIYVANRTSGTVTVIDGNNANSTAAVTVGSQPIALAVNPVTNEIYVANYNAASVTAINGATNSTSSPIGVGTNPVALAVNPVTNEIYVANYGSGNVTVINGSTNAAATTVNAGTNPNAVAVDAVSNKIYVANAGSPNVTVIDGISNSPVNVNTGTGSVAFAVALNPATDQIYAAVQGTNTVMVINGTTNTTSTLSAGTTPRAVAVNPVTDKIYVVNQGIAGANSTVTVIDGATNSAASTNAGSQPFAVAVNPVTNKIYVANSAGSTVTVIDGTNINSPTSVTVGNAPVAVAVNPVTNQIYAVNQSSRTVTAIDANHGNATTTVGVGTFPGAVAVNPVTNRIYVTNYTDSTVSVIDGATNTVIATPGVGVNPDAIAVNPVTNKTYVANYKSGNVVVIDGINNVVGIKTGTNPQAVAVNPVTNTIYSANFGDGTVSVINGATNTVSATVTVGSNPLSVAVNPVTNKVYVANSGGGTVTVIDANNNNATTSVTAGTAPWAVAVDPVTNKIYVANAAIITQFNANITIIDGNTNTTSTITTLNQEQPVAVAVNPVTNQVYIADQFGNDVSVITEQQGQLVPITASIAPLVGNQTSSLSPTFNFSGSNTFSGAPVNNLLYQFDTWQGPWTAAIAAGAGAFTGAAANLQPGFHILYAYATDGEDGTTTNTGNQNSPLIGNIAAYGFLVSPSGASVAPSSLNYVNQTVTVASSPQFVTLANGGGAPLTFQTSFTGGDGGDFSASNSGTCSTLGGTLAAGASCTIGVVFTPSLPTHTESATMVITDNSNGFPGSTQTVSLSGTVTGNLKPNIAWSVPQPITYGTPLTGTQLNATALDINNNSMSGTFAYSPAANTVLPAGPQTLTVTFTPQDKNDYQIVSKNVQITVKQAILTVTPTNTTWQYQKTAPLTATYTGFVNGDTPAVVSGAPVLQTSATGTSPLGTYPITVASLGTLSAANYSFVSAPGTLTIVPGIPTIAWDPVSPITYGTALSTSQQLNATASYNGSPLTTGAYIYTLSTVNGTVLQPGAVLNPGTQTLWLSYNPQSANLATATVSVPVVVTIVPVITWSPASPITYGTALSNAQLDATATDPVNKVQLPGTFIYTPKLGTVLGAGSQTLSAQFIPTDSIDYMTTTATATLVVNQAPANSQATVTGTVIAGSKPKAIGVNPVTNTAYVANFGSGTVTVIDGTTNTIGTIAVGNQPAAVAVDPLTNRIYVANFADGTVTVIDGSGVNSPTTIDVGASPAVVAVNPATNKIYVANQGSNTVTVIDGTGANPPVTVSVGTSPYGLAVNPVTNKIYVANQGNGTAGSGSVSVINGVTNAVTATVVDPAANGPYALAVNPVTDKVFVTNLNSKTVTIIDAGNNNTVTSVNVGTSPWAVSVNPVTNKAYVANYVTGTVTVIDAGHGNATAQITAGTNPNAVAIDPVTNQIYVANLGTNNFTVIDGSTNTPTTVGVGTGPDAVAVNPVTNKIYIANNTSNNVSVVDGTTNTTFAIAAGDQPWAAAVNPVNNNVYVVNYNGGTVTAINGTATTSITVGTFPYAIAVNPVTNQVYVVNQGSSTVKGNVTVIDGATNATTPVSVGNDPSAVTLDPVTNQIYVANYVDDSVTVIDGTHNTPIATITVGKNPDALAVNTATNKIYVGNSGDATVSVIDGTTNTVTAVIPAGDTPFAIAVNPVTNKVYVADLSLGVYPGAGTMTVIDGSTNVPTTVTVGTEPFAIAVNPLTNQIYVANKDSNNITVINGSNNSTTMLSVGANPFAVAVNPVSNKIYIPDAGAVNGSYSISVIDGATNFITTLSAGTQPVAVAVNPVTNQVYVANQFSGNVTVLTEQQVQAIPIVASITPLTGNQTTNFTPAFNFTASNSFTGAPVENLLYQVDTWQGPWTPATSQGSGAFAGSTTLLQPGYHILYAYATDGQEGTTTVAGLQNSPLIGNVTAYGFLVVGQTAGGGGASVSPGTINFGPQQKTITGPSRTLTLLNASTKPLTFAVSFGGTNPGDFVETTGTDTCGTLAGQLAANSSCTIGVTFTPATTGARSAVLTVTDNSNGVAGSTQTVNLSGTGTGNLVPTVSWNAPANITYGVPLSGAQLNATASYQGTSLPGTFTYAPALGTILSVGNGQVLSVTFTPQDTNDYAGATETVQIGVLPANLTVTANNATRQFGRQNPQFTAIYAGFVNGDTSSALTGSPVVTTTATTTSSAGTYPVTVAQGTLAAANYTFTFVPGTLTVTKATPTIAWGPLAPIAYGAALGAAQLNATSTVAGAGSTWVYSPPAGTVLNVGSQVLSVTLTPGDSTDYTTATATVTLQVNQAQALFVPPLDTTTKGKWQGVYGGDGYSLAQSSQNLPSYATFSVQNQTNYTWNPSTSDPRALAIPGGTGGIAATWYSLSTFDLDVNITDGHSHQVALYAVDWDGIGRAETIQIVDAVTNAVLDSESISNFSNGAYLVWNMSGHVKINVTETSGNAVISGVFFGGSSGTEGVSVSPGSVNLGAGGTQQFTATIHNGANQAVAWTVSAVNPSNGAAGSFSGTTAGLYTAPATLTGAETVTVKATLADGTSGTATVNLSTGTTGGGTSAIFVPPPDTTTGGSWQGVYGSDGYALAGVTPQSVPGYATFAVQNAANYTWASTTADPRAPQTGVGTGRIASVWYSNGFSLDVNFTDGGTHQFALYAVDWDSSGRSETIQVVDAATNNQLDVETLSNFTNGVYVEWNISGHVKINVTAVTGPNALVNGVFFGGGSSKTESVSVGPGSVNLGAGGTQQFTATIHNGANQAVAWTVSAVNPSNGAAGSFSGTTAGLYTAPAILTGAETVTVKATLADGTSGTATVNLSTGTTGGGATATFVPPADTTTGGSWQGVYGSDGYALAGVTPQNVPGYATFAVQNAANYTWASTTTDPRAPQTGVGTGRIASVWYSNGFSLDVNFTDGGTHQFALYAVDWDSSGRSETIQVVDAATNNQLDVETLSNFTNGVYVEWNISGHVKINVTAVTGPNALVNGVFFGGGSSKTESVSVGPGSVNLGAGGTQQFTATIHNGANQAVAWTVSAVNPSNGAAGSFSGTTAGLYTAPATLTGAETVTVKATLADGTSGTATVNLSTGTTGGGATATFVPPADTTTGGSWQGVYGSDGYALAGVTPQNVPGYATFAVQNAANYTWASTTTDPRAPQTGVGTGRIASVWYSNGFSLDVNFTDGGTHQFALYAVDWDSSGRSETIQVVDAATNNQLDVETLSNFTNGVYLAWNISGHVKINVTAVTGPNALVNGVFFGGGSSKTESVSVGPGSVNLGAGGTQQFTATIHNGANQAVAWTVSAVNPSNGAAGSFSGTTAGLYTAPATLTGAETVTVKATLADGTSGTATVNLSTGTTGGGATATFVPPADTTTGGSWQGVYGSDGYALAGVTPQNVPGYATFAVQNAANYTWASTTADPRAPQTGVGTGRIASVWYSNGFSLDVNFTDGGTHQFALYAVDWDSSGRSETIQVVDAATNNQLDVETLSNFTNGVYLAWNISGHVKINVTAVTGPNALVNGVFFGGGSSKTESVSVGPGSVNLGAGGTQQFTATIHNGANQAVAWTVSAVNPSNGAAGSFSGTTAGLYTAPATLTGAETVTVKAALADGTSGTATVNLSTGTTGGGATATFVPPADTTTGGSWQGVYGSDGYALAGVTPQNVPGYATFALQNQITYTWASTTTDPRAPQTGVGTGRIASAWYNPVTFSMDVNFTDGGTHQFALYAVDWDSGGRSETIQVVDAATNNQLDVETLSNFTNGVYLVWKISGHVKINVSKTGSSNALINGVFFK